MQPQESYPEFNPLTYIDVLRGRDGKPIRLFGSAFVYGYFINNRLSPVAGQSRLERHMGELQKRRVRNIRDYILDRQSRRQVRSMDLILEYYVNYTEKKHNALNKESGDIIQDMWDTAKKQGLDDYQLRLLHFIENNNILDLRYVVYDERQRKYVIKSLTFLPLKGDGKPTEGGNKLDWLFHDSAVDGVFNRRQAIATEKFIYFCPLQLCTALDEKQKKNAPAFHLFEKDVFDRVRRRWNEHLRKAYQRSLVSLREIGAFTGNERARIPVIIFGDNAIYSRYKAEEKQRQYADCGMHHLIEQEFFQMKENVCSGCENTAKYCVYSYRELQDYMSSHDTLNVIIGYLNRYISRLPEDYHISETNRFFLRFYKECARRNRSEYYRVFNELLRPYLQEYIDNSKDAVLGYRKEIGEKLAKIPQKYFRRIHNFPEFFEEGKDENLLEHTLEAAGNVIYNVSHAKCSRMLKNIVGEFNSHSYMGYEKLVETRRIIEYITHNHEGVGSIFDN